MTVDLFAGIPVSDLPAAIAWCERLLGTGAAFHPNDTEAVFEVAEHRYVYVELLPEHAGHARLTAFVEDLDARLAAAAERGLEPVRVEQYENGVRKAVFADRDGNEFGLGGGPA
jgi:catechol 2,3-dioxygenase-like lactoylglutathione lyase family enzyme